MPSVPIDLPSIERRTSPARRTAAAELPAIVSRISTPVSVGGRAYLRRRSAASSRCHRKAAWGTPSQRPSRHVREEVLHDGGRHHVGDLVGVLRDLHDDADHLAVPEHGSPAVARVDRAVDLAGEQLDVGVDVGLALDAGHDAARHAQGVAAEREAEDEDLLPQLGKAAELERGDGVEEARLVDGQEGEVGLVGHVEHAGGHTLGLAVPSHLDEGRVAHHVRVREDAVAGDHEPGARDRARGAGLPGRPVVRGQLGRVDLQDGVGGSAALAGARAPARRRAGRKRAATTSPACFIPRLPLTRVREERRTREAVRRRAKQT